MGSQFFQKKSLKLLLDEMAGEHRLKRILGPVTLTSLGVGAIIGAGIFVVTGRAAASTAGPAIMLSFVVAGIACVFAALCYAEFASMAPVAGSAYTYAYATLGELMAWIIGWDLVLEYAVGSATVANGWSSYLTTALTTFDVHLPEAIRGPTFNAQWGLTGSILNLPALLIVVAVTTVLVIGIRESAGFNAAMVVLKVAIVLFVIGVGAFYINPENWKPFAPYGYSGVSFFGYTILGEEGPAGNPAGIMAGAAIIFFAYIGFDSVSTHAEEARNPRRDVPIGIILSLVICTALYISVAAVITGMVPYTEIQVDAPLAAAFASAGLDWASLLIAIGGVAGITSVLLVMMLSQPRVLLAMARDGLLPPSFFGAVHPRFRTPWKSTILTGTFVGILASLFPIDLLTDLVNIGTLLAFVIVCAAVLIMRRTNPDADRPFRAPFVPLVPILGIIFCLVLMFSLPPVNWARLGAWLVLGLIIYFFYGRRHSFLARATRHEITAHGVSPAGSPARDVGEPPGE